MILSTVCLGTENNKHIEMIQNLFPFGYQEDLPLAVLMLLRTFITPRPFTYSLVRVCYVATSDKGLQSSPSVTLLK
jgi:hypothetical protein